jgi:lipopolysaccharide transport system ATP-binding protein
MTTAIRVQNLTKEYRLGTINHGTLRQDLQSWWAKLRGKEDPNSIVCHPAAHSIGSDLNPHFLALNDVSFDVQQGEAVGIIGRNGAGKSTLLKILSRVTAPSSGVVKIRGRVASLLEVGTGFHPELTGRENIFLNGTILGMKRSEIQRRFDEIVAFAEVEQFIDTPVKRYSSGMYVRLAFAVAAHLEPEVLIVDEVLAVGDAQFQRKCLGKMEDVGKEGRTVLFVSHNMAAIQKLCKSVLLLENGRNVNYGNQREVISGYLKQAFECAHISLVDRKDRQGNGDIRFSSFALQNEQGQNVSAFNSGDDVRFIIGFHNPHKRALTNLIVDLGIDNHMGERITVLSNEIKGEIFDQIPAEASKIEIKVNRLPLTGGSYSFTLFASANGTILDWVQNAGYFNVESGDFYGSGKISAGQGNFLLDYSYDCK